MAFFCAANLEKLKNKKKNLGIGGDSTKGKVFREQGFSSIFRNVISKE